MLDCLDLDDLRFMDRTQFVVAFDLPIEDVKPIDAEPGGRSCFCIGGGERVEVRTAKFHGISKVAGFLCKWLKRAGQELLMVWHYTNAKGHCGIVIDGFIRPSNIKQGDASYGSGVYVTGLHPSRPFWEVLKNNYDNDGGIQDRGEDKSDRADYAFFFLLPEKHVKFIPDRERSVGRIGEGENVQVMFGGKAADVLKGRFSVLLDPEGLFGISDLEPRSELRDDFSRILELGEETLWERRWLETVGKLQRILVQMSRPEPDKVHFNTRKVLDRQEAIAVSSPSSFAPHFESRGNQSFEPTLHQLPRKKKRRLEALTVMTSILSEE